MIRRCLTLLALVVLSSALGRAGLVADPPGVRFRTIDEGFAEARASGKPLLLYFTADWCPPCHNLELEVFHSSLLSKGIEAEFVPVKVVDRRREDGHNAPDVDALQKNTGVSAFPTLLVVRADGSAAVRNVGYSSRGATLAFLREAVSRLESAERKKRRAGAS
ncbi:MAG: thioredoxin family protein [Thermoanaerobaculia bacterium]